MMKQFKLFVIAAVLFAGVQAASAQVKVAHINVQELILTMPEMKSANAILQKLEDTHKAELKKMMAEYQAKVEQYSREAETTSQAQYESRVKEVKDMEGRIQEYDQAAQQEIVKKQEELYKPIIEKSKAAIQKVAKAQGFTYVLDSSTGKGVLVADGTDLLADVKKELGF